MCTVPAFNANFAKTPGVRRRKEEIDLSRAKTAQFGNLGGSCFDGRNWRKMAALPSLPLTISSLFLALFSHLSFRNKKKTTTSSAQREGREQYAAPA